MASGVSRLSKIAFMTRLIVVLVSNGRPLQGAANPSFYDRPTAQSSLGDPATNLRSSRVVMSRAPQAPKLRLSDEAVRKTPETTSPLVAKTVDTGNRVGVSWTPLLPLRLSCSREPRTTSGLGSRQGCQSMFPHLWARSPRDSLSSAADFPVQHHEREYWSRRRKEHVKLSCCSSNARAAFLERRLRPSVFPCAGKGADQSAVDSTSTTAITAGMYGEHGRNPPQGIPSETFYPRFPVPSRSSIGSGSRLRAGPSLLPDAVRVDHGPYSRPTPLYDTENVHIKESKIDEGTRNRRTRRRRGEVAEVAEAAPMAPRTLAKSTSVGP
ncbi:uncharacterized protein BXZ73DRAFT_78000 [Epithele typhae]|uniref:uncharacterized protein n=1 Tax=Epithele typhae TaxID=378194 RepID=UPI00200816FC|nr:uncharacterized protein BXZ73DRAFT_78000 [Epithele typhae]KAH9929886.1 hypothetical protein BXZ73DRAFT_78000 [Epithele typhae]